MDKGKNKSTPRTGTPKPAAANSISNTSMEELTDLSKQIEEMTEDLKTVKEDIKLIMKKDDMITLIKETVNHMMIGLTESFEMTLKTRIDAETKHLQIKITDLQDENKQLKNDMFQIKNELKMMKIREEETSCRSKAAMAKSNYNEQYSRKNNFKIMDIKEEADETIEKLTTDVCDMVKARGATLDPAKIVAIHRIPGKKGHPKPVLVKLVNNHEKTNVMKLRKEFKANGTRLVDDVTKLNAQHPEITQAWYFNGSVYGKSVAEKRFKFDLFDDIDSVLRS